jgi:excisionase family DNA binding protein
MKEWLTLDEAAVLVGRTKRTLYQWIENGRIHPRRAADGGQYLVRSSEVTGAEAIVKRGRPKGSAKAH